MPKTPEEDDKAVQMWRQMVTARE